MNIASLTDYISLKFDSQLTPALADFIAIDNQSRAFDPLWNTNPVHQRAAQHIVDWVKALKIQGITCEIVQDQGYSPLIFTEVKGTLPQTIFFYGHFDKQPPMKGWRQGLAPYTPVIEDGKLYGRGGADDGYATFSTMLAIKALQVQGLQLPRCVMITEGDQESGSCHMAHYLATLKDRIGEPSSFFCLDSGTLDYDRLWLTNSLRGNLVATLRVDVLQIALHSGDTSGVVPSCFRIARTLLDRLENIETGQVNQRFHVNVPPLRYAENLELAKEKKQLVFREFPFSNATEPNSKDPLTCLLNRNWRPSLTIIGQNGFPEAAPSGNALHPWIQFRFSLRLPPTFQGPKAVEILHEILTKNVPYNAKVTLKDVRTASGWNANPYEDYFATAVKQASQIFYKNKCLCLGQGGSIPLMGDLNAIWPGRQYLVTGVLGPKSNAHGPNQFIDLEYTKKLTCCLAYVVGKTAQHLQK